MAKYQKGQTNNKDNAFIKVLKAIFVKDIIAKLICFGIAMAFWVIAVGLGVSSPGLSHKVPFFEGFADNLTAEFSTPLRIVVSIIDFIGIFLVIYFTSAMLRKNKNTAIIKFLAILTATLMLLTSSLLSFPLFGGIFGSGLMVIVVLIIVLFPHELRRTILRMASKTEGGREVKAYDCTEDDLRASANDLVKAILNMSKNNIGALIILTNQSVPAHILESGTELGAKISQQLIECLFNTNANLHDGAVFIRGNRVLSAGCFLPLSQSQTLSRELGTRHRAALGVTEQYDVVTIVVSEETGVISVAKEGKLDRYYDAIMLNDVIEEVYGLKATGRRKRRRSR